VFHIAADLRDGLRPPRDDELSAARQRRALLNALKAGCLFIGIAAAARKAVDS
jgi:hypothetical protein